MDVHVPDAITVGLRLRRVDVLTAHEDGARRLSDALLLAHPVMAFGSRPVQSRRRTCSAKRPSSAAHGVSFTGVIYAHQLKVTIGQCVRDLELVAHAGAPEDFANRVEYLPLR